MLLAIYPLLQGNFSLSFVQIGFITLAFQFSASLLQPVVGYVTDRRPFPYSLPIGMGFTCVGLLLLSRAWNYPSIIVAAVLVGAGSSVFHPASSRVARIASAGRHGLAQSIFQVGGNLGSSIGPLLAAFLIIPLGQSSMAWVSLAALAGIIILLQVSRWYSYFHSGFCVGQTHAWPEPAAQGGSQPRVSNCVMPMARAPRATTLCRGPGRTPPPPAVLSIRMPQRFLTVL